MSEPFTDEDLKRLKKAKGNVFLPDEIKAILDRLEAAEAVCENILAECDTWTHKSTLLLIEAWRKATGK